MQLLLVFLLLASVRAQQYPCSCSCCNTPSCTPSPLPTVYVSFCTTDTCTAQCRATYSQCQVTSPYGQVVALCGTTSAQLYSCRCECCNSGSPLCSPSYIGNSYSYTCQPGACSISCTGLYPTQCISNQNGQTQGTCIGLVTTTTTTTTIGPWLGNSCTCMCCQTGPSCTTTNVGTTSASVCSSTACTQACQSRYPTTCPSIYGLGQTNGICTTTTSGTTRCSCRCCPATGCLNFDLQTNGGCTSCDAMCRSQTLCSSTSDVTYTCSTNHAKTFHPWLFFILPTVFLTFFFFN